MNQLELPVSVPHVADVSDEGKPRWYRAVAMIPGSWLEGKLALKLHGQQKAEAWCNGRALQSTSKASGKVAAFPLPADSVEADDWNLIVIKLDGSLLADPPVLASGEKELRMLAGLAISYRRSAGVAFQHAAASQIWWIS